MNNRDLALRAANIADKLTYVSKVKDVNGQKSVVLEYDEAMAMKNDLVIISHRLNDIQDAQDKSN